MVAVVYEYTPASRNMNIKHAKKKKCVRIEIMRQISTFAVISGTIKQRCAQIRAISMFI